MVLGVIFKVLSRSEQIFCPRENLQPCGYFCVIVYVASIDRLLLCSLAWS